MRVSLHRRGLRSGVLASILALSVASPVGAITWHPAVQLTDSTDGWGYANGIAVTGSNSLVTVYEDDGFVYVRRSGDGGVSWSDRMQLSTGDLDAWRSTVAAAGQKVDVTWTEGDGCWTTCPLYYAKSTDGGAHFGATKRLSPKTSLVLASQVARRGNVVAIAWTDAGSDNVIVRVSRDGGATFSSARILDHTTNTPRPVWDQGKDANVAVAVGKGVIYVAYFPSSGRLFVRRSTDGGVTWKPRVRLATNVYSYDPPSIAAAGTGAVLAYPHGADPAWIVSRRTTDKGATWKSEVAISNASRPSASGPIVGVGGGRYAVAFDRCTTNACPVTKIALRVSTNGGASWGAESTVFTGTSERPLTVPYGVAVANRITVAYWLADWPAEVGDVWTRSAD